MKKYKAKVFQLAFFIMCLTVIAAQTKEEARLDKKDIKKSMIKAMEWQEDNPIFAKAPTDWTNGAYYTGVVRAHKVTGEKRFKKALIKMGERNAWQPYERFYHADDLAICYSYLYLESVGVKKVDLEPTKNIIHEHLFKPHAWKDGSEGGDKQTLWYWCDALFMAPPVITMYSEMNDDVEYLDDMHSYYMKSYDLLFDQDEHLFARDLRFVWKGDSTDKKEENGEKVFWSRGNGWVLGGLALMLEKMPEDYVNRPFYVDLFKKMASRVKEIQPEDGLWRTSLLYPDAYDHGEVSGSGFFTFALAWGVNNGLLDKQEYSDNILKGWSALRQCQHENGMIGWVQDIGYDPRPAAVDSWQNYGTGAYLLAGSEILKMDW